LFYVECLVKELDVFKSNKVLCLAFYIQLSSFTQHYSLLLEVVSYQIFMKHEERNPENRDKIVIFDQGIRLNLMSKFYSGFITPRGIAELIRSQVLKEKARLLYYHGRHDNNR